MTEIQPIPATVVPQLRVITRDAHGLSRKQMSQSALRVLYRLREAGFGDLVYETVNANSLSAFVKEQIMENGDALPAWLDGLVTVFEKTTVGVRKATR